MIGAISAENGDDAPGRKELAVRDKMVSTSGYGWAHTTVVQLCKLDPLNIEFCLEADRQTAHYVALAVRGAERSQSSAFDMKWLASVLPRQRRREAIAHLWQQDAGNLNVLRKCRRSVFPRAFYDALMAILADPQRRMAIRHLDALTPVLVDAILQTDLNLLAIADSKLLTQFGGPGVLRYLIEGAQTLRPNTTPAQIVQSLKTLDQRLCLDHWISEWASKASLPPPPWAGTAEICPIRTIKEMQRLGRQFRNCLGFHCWQDALKGERAYYLCCNGSKPAIACLARFALFDKWHLEEIRGYRNASVRSQSYADAFAKAGFPTLGKEFVWTMM